MSEYFKTAVRVFSEKKNTVTVGKVTEVSGNTCKVEREFLPPLLDVRLQSINGEFENHLVIKPVINSEVICLTIEGENAETCIIKYSEIQSIEAVVKGATLKIEDGKIQLKNENSDLKKMLSELLNELKTAIILTPIGPGTFSPNNIKKFTELEVKTKQLFK